MLAQGHTTCGNYFSVQAWAWEAEKTGTFCYVVPTTRSPMAKQLWIAIQLLQGQNSLSWSIASIMFNLKHQESLSTQHTCCQKHSYNTWLFYTQRHWQQIYKRKKVMKTTYKFTSFETSPCRISIRVLCMTVIYETSISLFQFPRTFQSLNWKTCISSVSVLGIQGGAACVFNYVSQHR